MPVTTRSKARFKISEDDFLNATVTESVEGQTTATRSRSFPNAICRRCRPLVLDLVQLRSVPDLTPLGWRQFRQRKRRNCAFCNLLLLGIRRWETAARTKFNKMGDMHIYISLDRPTKVIQLVGNFEAAGEDVHDICVLDLNEIGASHATKDYSTPLGRIPVRHQLDAPSISSWLMQS